MYDRGLDFVTEVLEFSSLKSSPNYCRKYAERLQRDLAVTSQIVFPEEVIKIKDKTKFVFMDENMPFGEILHNSSRVVKTQYLWMEHSKAAISNFVKYIHINIDSTLEKTNNSSAICITT